jgi:hypothetical protein
MDGVVNKHNVHFWAAENPHMFIGKVHYADKILTRAIILSDGQSNLFLTKLLNTDLCQSMLHNSFMFQLVADKHTMVCAEWGSLHTEQTLSWTSS